MYTVRPLRFLSADQLFLTLVFGFGLGYVLDILLSAVMGADLDIATKSAVLRAFNKVIWIQNDRKYYS